VKLVTAAAVAVTKVAAAAAIPVAAATKEVEVAMVAVKVQTINIFSQQYVVANEYINQAAATRTNNRYSLPISDGEKNTNPR
jgi:hypothetical protein